MSDVADAIERARDELRSVESLINEAVRDFEEETGLRINRFEILRGGGPHGVVVKISAGLDA